MMRKILCLAAVMALSAVFPASAETVRPVTAEELNSLLESARTEALEAEPLNDPTDAEAQSEDGTLIQYETARFYMDGESLTAESPVNVLSFDDGSKPVLRGLGIYSALEEVLTAFPNENAELAGTREEALLYLTKNTADGFVYGRILRDGQRVIAAEYGEVLPAGEGFRCVAVTFSLQEGLVSSVRVDGLNPGAGQLDASYANEFLAELTALAARDEYRAVKTSRDGLQLTAFDENDLAFGGIAYAALTPETLPGETQQEKIDNEDGTWLLRCEGTGYEAVFLCDENGTNARILSFSILDDQAEGPRGVRLGDLFSEDFCRFRSGENDMTDDMTELLYGSEDGVPRGVASYNPDDMSLRYVTATQDGLQVELILRYVDNYLTEIMLQTV